jgi:hypothetical protein
MNNEDWYLRSCMHGDTHHGYIDPYGWVIARCGLRFEPLADLFKSGGVAVALSPVPAGQKCGTCQSAGPPADAIVERTSNALLGVWVQRQDGLDQAERIATIINRLGGADIQDLLGPEAPPRPSPVAAEPSEPTDDAKGRPRPSWHQERPGPGGTHWVITTVRGVKVAACGVSCHGGRLIGDPPAPGHVCPDCDTRRPR